MLTLFATPKTFRDLISITQQNAIESWTRLKPRCEIILFGDEEGTNEVVTRLGIQQVSEVVCNEYGTPLLSDMFQKAQDLANHNLLCFLNADIILTSELTQAIPRIPWTRYLMAGQRWDLDLSKPLNFTDPDWETKIISRAHSQGSLRRPGSIDYFVYPKGTWNHIPDFAIGRPGYDNWLIWRARSQGIPVVDATQTVTPIHQNHHRVYT